MSDAECNITARPDLGILVARWTADAPATELRAQYATILASAQQHQLSRWLLDVRRRDQLDPEIGQWTTHVFYPEVARVLAPLPVRLGVLCSPARLAIYNQAADQHQFLSYGLAAERPYQLQLFIEEGTALAWLLQ
ncbi:hypothetical protein K3G63_11910 [Hymenobacter sp. HSC-4F20]|uniref:hypothetical protein n=1 Tax=Hymenobacter sp. HSC-4F20 TaxID=2864135 RepID=UPI001C735915|nr:hypothetical protein [Hymenobacter sp. HSC-4F20]MBX0291152.1 hypothetical protein [Hymenobacter sp. HSC-4F20]